ncbi:hepatic leukemia factor-like [Penaeus indicus]|uniref:hepatic leukemia factor-like n=1 Tax=Penaeus indicus TaxID=29960 RepID=UPI00300C1174
MYDDFQIFRPFPVISSKATLTSYCFLFAGKSGKDGEEKKEGGEWEQYNAGAAFLGPTLWDKTLSYDSDLKVSLEYMDLDEFLNENGIPLDEGGKRASSASTGGSNTNSTTSGTGSSLTLGSVLSPEAPSSPDSPQRVGSGMGVAGGPQTPAPMGQSAAPITVLPPALSPQDCTLEGYPSSPESSVSLDPHDPLQVHEPGKLDPNLSSLTLDTTYPFSVTLGDPRCLQSFPSPCVLSAPLAR